MPCKDCLHLTWEYQTEYGINSSYINDNYLNKLGKEGWELVVIIDEEFSSKKLIFKRPIFL